jgi:hypothetical protein
VALKRVQIPSPNCSGRSGAAVRLVVVHCSEGAQTYQSLGNFFANPSSGVSSHTGIDDTPGVCGEYVARGSKAWTAASANPYAVQTELCTPSGASQGWSTATWHGHPTMLANCAQWIAEECAAFGLPIVKLTPTEAQGSGRGVCGHVDLGSWGGGHTDPGPAFPWADVIAMASGGAPTPTPPAPTDTSGDNLICVDPKTGGTWCVASREGAVNAEGGAPYIGGTNNNSMNQAKYPCVGIGLRPGDDGFRIVLDWGDGGGGMSKDKTGRRFRTYDFPRNGSGKVSGGTY